MFHTGTPNTWLTTLLTPPEICVILLGTNDTKPQNWDVYGHEFIDDYLCSMSLALALRKIPELNLFSYSTPGVLYRQNFILLPMKTDRSIT